MMAMSERERITCAYHEAGHAVGLELGTRLVERDPPDVEGGLVLAVALVAIPVNLAAARSGPHVTGP